MSSLPEDLEQSSPTSFAAVIATQRDQLQLLTAEQQLLEASRDNLEQRN